MLNFIFSLIFNASERLYQSDPHEGCRIATLPPAIVGLSRNSLSEASRLGEAVQQEVGEFVVLDAPLGVRTMSGGA